MESTDDQPNQALIASNNVNKRKSRGRGRYRRVAGRGNMKCFNCKEFVHMSKDCRKPKRRASSSHVVDNTNKRSRLLWGIRNEHKNNRAR